MVSEEEPPTPEHDDSDDVIYDDIMEFDFEDKQDKHGGNEKTNVEVQELLEKVKDLTKENEELRKLNEALNKNLSSLLKTAKNEVNRKDSIINNLRSELEEALCKIRSKITKDKYTETEKWDNEWRSWKKGDRLMKSKENRSSEFEPRLADNKERKKSSERKDDNFLACDNSRRSKYYREKRSSSPDKYRGRESYKYRDKDHADSRRSFKHNYRDHLKYDSLDKKRHSDKYRTSPPSKKSSREKDHGRRMENVEKYKNDRSQSRERQRSSTKESSSEKSNVKPKKTSSKPDKPKPEDSKTKKEEKRNSNVFERISPLDSLYSEPVGVKNISRDWNQRTSEVEEGELPENSFSEGDWALSFKNERKTSVKPLTLYSRRMLKKISEEEKASKKKKMEENEKEEMEKEEKIVETPKSRPVEKEPGELTDDEHIVESSKEFQELTKVASMENKFNDSKSESLENIIFKEPLGKEVIKKKNAKEKCVDEDAKHPKEEEKPGGQLIEFSPFKNNYKLIEISPVKQPSKDHVLDFYKAQSQTQNNSVSPMVDLIMSSIKPGEGKIADQCKNEKKLEETNDCFKVEEETQKSELNVGNLKKTKTKEKKVVEKTKKSEIVEDKKPEVTEPSDSSLGRGKRKGGNKKENEVSVPGEKNQKRKREGSECKEEKRQKTNEGCGRVTRSKKEKVTKSEPDKEKTNEDISFFEFFKPITSKTKVSEGDTVPSSCTGDYKMSTTMSVTSVLCLETPNKKVEKLKNLTINEQVICHVNVDSKNGFFSPAMTPRRMLKNDLMLTDSEDDSIAKKEEKDSKEDEDEEDEDQDFEDSLSQNSDSDSGASDFVDLL